MTEHANHMRELAELAISNGECGAQLEIKDEELRRALTEAITTQLLQATARARP
jgi:hypothetical protein